MATGNAISSTPKTNEKAPIIFPGNDFGDMTPYPTVVIVITAHQMASGIFPISLKYH